jgi:alpha-glucoside transport system substrate-binding protein
MKLKNNMIFFLIFISTTLIFSIIAYKPNDVVIGGPNFPQVEYFIEELNVISQELDIKIQYQTYNDIETYLIENPNHNLDLVLLPNPQGAVNLGQRGITVPIENIFEEAFLKENFAEHLLSITTSERDNLNYGAWFRVIPNSLVWYDVSKYEALGSPVFSNYKEMVNFTQENSDKDEPLWCLDIESGASTGWIATNWLEDTILHKYGPEVYDAWSQQDKLSSSEEVTLSILDIGKLIFIEDAVYGGHKRMVRKEFRNNYRNLLDDEISCTFSWSGHFASYYFPDTTEYGKDYDFFKLPSQNYKNAMVGIGDVLAALNHNSNTINTAKLLLSVDFGEIWLGKDDSQYISANMNSRIVSIKNPMLIKETNLIKASFKQNLFRYDASELMERRIGSDSLWYALTKYIELKSLYINEVTEELDSTY